MPTNPFGISTVEAGVSAAHPQQNIRASALPTLGDSGLTRRSPFSAAQAHTVADLCKIFAQFFLAQESGAGSSPIPQPPVIRKKLTPVQANSFLENGETPLTAVLKEMVPSPIKVRDLLLAGAWQHLKNKKGEAPLMLLNQIPPRRVMWNVQFYFLNINMPMANKAKSLKSFLEQYSASKTEERRAAFRAFVHGMG